jgi:hypothetical protein
VSQIPHKRADAALVHWELIGQIQRLRVYSQAIARCGMKKSIDRSGKAGYIIAWLLGVPIPILLLVFLLRGCN